MSVLPSALEAVGSPLPLWLGGTKTIFFYVIAVRYGYLLLGVMWGTIAALGVAFLSAYGNWAIIARKRA
jgi:hypothetical protein